MPITAAQRAYFFQNRNRLENLLTALLNPLIEARADDPDAFLLDAIQQRVAARRAAANQAAIHQANAPEPASAAPAPEPVAPTPPPEAPAPAPESDRDDNGLATKWTAEGWLESLGFEGMVAKALLGEGFEGDQLIALRALGRSDTVEDDLREPLAAAVELLVKKLALRLKDLATAEAATVGEMQTKFSQETKGMLQYGTLNTF